MKAQAKWLWLVVAASSLVMSGRVQAAERATLHVEVGALSQYAQSRTIRVNYSATDTVDLSSIDSYDLYLRQTDGSYVKTMTSYDGAPFYYTAPADGLYTFYVVANNGPDSSPISATVSTTVDTVAPATLDVSKLNINQDTSLVSGEVTGGTGAVEGGATVEMYADSAMTSLLRSTVSTSNGSFGPMAIGGATVRSVYLAARDAAGNRGAAIKLDNNMSYAASLSGFTLKADGGNAVVVSFAAPSSAKQFRVQYRHAGGAVWSVDYFTVGTNGTTIRLTGLEAGRAYDVRVAPVDANLNVGLWSAGSVRTVGTKVDKVVLPSERVVTASATSTTVTSATSAAVSSSTTTSAASETATPATSTDDSTVTTPVTTDDTSANVATNDEQTPAEATNEAATNDEAEQSGSATPWVILAILIVLAGIATGGYFYWFSGPEEVTTAVTPNEEKKSEEKSEPTTDEDKRW